MQLYLRFSSLWSIFETTKSLICPKLTQHLPTYLPSTYPTLLSYLPSTYPTLLSYLPSTYPTLVELSAHNLPDTFSQNPAFPVSPSINLPQIKHTTVIYI